MVTIQHAVFAFAHVDLDDVGLVRERFLDSRRIVFAAMPLAAAMGNNPRPLPYYFAR
jgi:hypothetical protein